MPFVTQFFTYNFLYLLKVGKIKDGARSLSRAIQNNLMDQGKQEAMDKLLQSNVNNIDLLHVSRDLLGHDQLYCKLQYTELFFVPDVILIV